jgi:hypothetical protein
MAADQSGNIAKKPPKLSIEAMELVPIKDERKIAAMRKLWLAGKAGL